MKKYLFDEISVRDKRVCFITFREPSAMEFAIFTYANDGSAARGDGKWAFEATSFKKCLSMLKKTKLNDDYEFYIYNSSMKEMDFEQFIKVFAGQQYAVKAPNEQVISEFYNRAYQIREEARRDKKLLEREPSSYIGGNATEQDSVEPETERE